MATKIDAVVIELDRAFPVMDFQVTYLQKDPSVQNPVYYGRDITGDFDHDGFTSVGAACFITRSDFESENPLFPESASVDAYDLGNDPETAVVNSFILSQIFEQKLFPRQENIYNLKAPGETQKTLKEHTESLMLETGVELGEDVRKNIVRAVQDLNDYDMQAIGFKRRQNNDSVGLW